MLHEPTTGCTVYEVEIYNKEVRALVKDNQSHTFFEDHWADVQVRDIEAHTETEAREKISKRYPPMDGFVIAGIQPANVDCRVA